MKQHSHFSGYKVSNANIIHHIYCHSTKIYKKKVHAPFKFFGIGSIKSNFNCLSLSSETCIAIISSASQK